jgi:hypothetical protein
MPIFAFCIIFLLFGDDKNKTERLILYFLTLLPIINFAKGGFFFYNIISVVLLLYLIYLLIKEPSFFRGFGIEVNYFYLFFGFSVVYYIFSFLNTGHYDSNLRIFELFITAILVARLWSNKDYFNLFILILSLNSIAFVVFMLRMAGEGSRLMLNNGELLELGVEIGGNNPISYGLPIAFCIVSLISYLRWANFLNKIYYIIVLGMLFLTLFLTTSRGSILILILTLPLYFYLSGKLTELLKLISLLLLFNISMTLLSSVIPDFQFAYEFLVDRTQSDADLNRISHGRTEQWQAMKVYSQTNLSDLIFGFGPGKQFDAHEVISMSLYGVSDASFQGKRIAFHALPLQLISEVGLIGVFIFYTLAFKMFSFICSVYRSQKVVLSLLGFIGWFGAGLSVSSLDPFSGLFLGIAIIPVFNKI